jgi:hypothetical protein
VSSPTMTQAGTSMPFRAAPRSYGDLESQLRPQPQQPPEQPAAGTAVEVGGGITGHVMPKYADGPLCDVCFPEPAELTRLAWSAQHGQPAVPFVGSGSEWMPLSCAHSDLPWRLGDQMVYVSAWCLKQMHERCLDQACACECRGSDARQALTASEGMLAQALREIGGTLRGDVGPEIMARLEALEGVGAAKDARIAELEAKLAAQPVTVVTGVVLTGDVATGDCQDTNSKGQPCKMHPKAGEKLCPVHKSKAEAKAGA